MTTKIITNYGQKTIEEIQSSTATLIWDGADSWSTFKVASGIESISNSIIIELVGTGHTIDAAHHINLNNVWFTSNTITQIDVVAGATCDNFPNALKNVYLNILTLVAAPFLTLGGASNILFYCGENCSMVTPNVIHSAINVGNGTVSALIVNSGVSGSGILGGKFFNNISNATVSIEMQGSAKFNSNCMWGVSGGSVQLIRSADSSIAGTFANMTGSPINIFNTGVAGQINAVDTNVVGSTTVQGILDSVTKRLVNRVTVGLYGKYTTIKDAVDWFNASATSNTEILLDAGHHNISDTIVVDNGSYDLQIRGLGSAVTYLDAVTGLANKPMFEFRTNCDINKVTATGSTLAGYGNNAGEDFVQITTNVGTYHEFKDIFIDTFNIGIKDVIGSGIFIFDFYISDCISQGVEINHTGSGELDAEVGTIENCPISFDLISATVAEDIFLNSIYYINANPTDVAINYDGTAVTYTNFSIINGNWNKVGFFISGFDFHRTDGRDSNIEMISNVGYEDKNAHSKMNVVDNTTLTTTLTAANTYYKVTGVRSETRIIFDAAATSGNFTITYDGQTTGNIAYNASAANIKTALEALSNITTVTVTQVIASKEWKIRFDTDGEGFEWTQSVDISGLGTTTSVEVLKSFYGCKIGFGFGKMIYQSEHGKDGVMWISGNVQVNQINRNITLGLKKNNTGQIISPMTVRTSTSNQPVSFSLIAYLDDIEQNDYFEIFASSANAGDVITLQDLNWYFESR